MDTITKCIQYAIEITLKVIIVHKRKTSTKSRTKWEYFPKSSETYGQNKIRQYFPKSSEQCGCGCVLYNWSLRLFQKPKEEKGSQWFKKTVHRKGTIECISTPIGTSAFALVTVALVVFLYSLSGTNRMPS